MKPLKFPLFATGPEIQTLAKTSLTLPQRNIYKGEENLSLSDLHYNLLIGGTQEENIFRARLLLGELNKKITLLGGLHNIFSTLEIPVYESVINDISKMSNGEISLSDRVLSSKNAEVVFRLIGSIEEFEKNETYNKQIKGSLDTVVNGITDRIISILIKEALARGSYINIALALARLNPIWEIPDELGMAKYLTEKVLTDDFKQCIKDAIRGNNINKELLNPLQKKFFYMANVLVFFLLHTPDQAIKFLPRLGKVTRLSLHIIQNVPAVGPLFNSFFGPIDEAIAVVGLYGDEIKTLKKEAKKARVLSKLVSNAVSALKGLKDESVDFIHQFLKRFG